MERVRHRNRKNTTLQELDLTLFVKRGGLVEGEYTVKFFMRNAVGLKRVATLH